MNRGVYVLILCAVFTMQEQLDARSILSTYTPIFGYLLLLNSNQSLNNPKKTTRYELNLGKKSHIWYIYMSHTCL
jgi:hypothetical protein